MSLKGIVRKTLQGNPTGMVCLRDAAAASVCEEMEELEKTIVDCFSKIKTAVKEREAVVANEGEHAEQVIESLRGNVGVLEAKVRETEDTVQRKDAASQRMEQVLSAKIVDLLDEMKKKDESLDSRGNEIKDLKVKIDVEAKHVTELEQALKQAKVEIAVQSMRAQQITANANATTTALEAQVKEAREIIRNQACTIKGLEQSHSVKIQDLESQIRSREKDLADREKEVEDLRSEVTTLTKTIKEMSSFFKQAEALASIHSKDILADGQAQSIGALDSNKQANITEPKPAAPQPIVLTVTSNTSDASREETVPPGFFDSITRELSEALGPMAPLILRDHVKAVGESMEKFPKTRIAELLDNVCKEIPNEKIKISFREHLHKLHISFCLIGNRA